MQLGAMQVTMVKKRLAGGEPCRKCLQAEEILRTRGAWHRIDRVVWAVEDEPESEGMQLARTYGMDTAPFFLVDDSDGARVAYDSVLKLLRDRFESEPKKAVAAVDAADIDGITHELEHRSPAEIVRWALTHFGRDCALAFSGAEDVVLIDMAVKSGGQFSLFSLDTGRLHPETYRFMERVRSHYAVDLELVSPDPAQLQPFVRTKGLFSFYEDGHQECCGMRKVAPLRRALGGYRAWITGQRRDQSPTRTDVPVVQIDPGFQGRGGGACSSSTRLPVGPRRKPGPTCATMACPTTSSTSAVLRRSAASRARGPRTPDSTSARDAGGGRRRPRRSAACTARCPRPAPRRRPRVSGTKPPEPAGATCAAARARGEEPLPGFGSALPHARSTATRA